MAEWSGEKEAGCVACGSDIDRIIPDPIPEGYECMWSEAMSGKTLYCLACYSGSSAEPDAGERGAS